LREWRKQEDRFIPEKTGRTLLLATWNIAWSLERPAEYFLRDLFEKFFGESEPQSSSTGSDESAR
jgi:hypothetical protein